MASARELVAELRGRGVAVSAIAEQLGVSPRMVRKVAGGDVPGARYERALDQLARTGRVYHRPERRTTRSGELVPVRAPRSAGVKSAPPPLPPARPAAGKFGVDTALTAGGGRVTVVTAPKSSSAVGREEARQAILRDVQRAAREGKRVRFDVRDANGRTAVLGAKGGYQAKAVARRMRAEGDDPLGWLSDELDGISAYADLGTLTRVTVQVF